MYVPGHHGVALLAYAPVGGALVAAGEPGLALAGGLGAVGLTMLPDWDSRVPGCTHRGETHTLAFAGAAGVGTWTALGPVLGESTEGTAIRAFFAGVGTLSILAHLAADAFNPAGVAPLWPLSDRRYSLDLVRADHAVANDALLAAGVAAATVAAALGEHVAARHGWPAGPPTLRDAT